MTDQTKRGYEEFVTNWSAGDYGAFNYEVYGLDNVRVNYFCELFDRAPKGLSTMELLELVLEDDEVTYNTVRRYIRIMEENGILRRVATTRLRDVRYTLANPLDKTFSKMPLVPNYPISEGDAKKRVPIVNLYHDAIETMIGGYGPTLSHQVLGAIARFFMAAFDAQSYIDARDSESQPETREQRAWRQRIINDLRDNDELLVIIKKHALRLASLCDALIDDERLHDTNNLYRLVSTLLEDEEYPVKLFKWPTAFILYRNNNEVKQQNAEDAYLALVEGDKTVHNKYREADQTDNGPSPSVTTPVGNISALPAVIPSDSNTPHQTGQEQDDLDSLFHDE